MNGEPSAWERFWHRDVPAKRLAAFRIAVAWICLYDAFLYDPTYLVANYEAVEATWNPLVVFDALGLRAPTAGATANLSLAYKVSVLLVLVGWRTRAACLLMALLAFWQGGLFYSLTKVRHDRVALCFATCALACSPCGACFSLDAWLRRGRDALAPVSWWPMRLTQVTIAIGYCAAGFTKLLQPGWMNGYTLQGIVLGHRGPFADVAASHVGVCQVLSIASVATQTLVPLCLWWPRLLFWLLPAGVCFHLGTWATMDTGPYLTLWTCWIAFVPLDVAWSRLRELHASRPWLARATVAFAAGVFVVIAVVMARVVPWPWLLAAGAITVAVVRAGPRLHGVYAPRSSPI